MLAPLFCPDEIFSMCIGTTIKPLVYCFPDGLSRIVSLNFPFILIRLTNSHITFRIVITE
ncbi:hypothetical protein DESC_650002 [Desulfosarcina cetonica]|nr:hypothetical protein DESC_650002 [Desulfosarcina cetonica]